MKTKCPHCNTVQNAPDEAAGREALCKSCRKVFAISEYTTPVVLPLPDPPKKKPRRNFFGRVWGGYLNLLHGRAPPTRPPPKPPGERVRTICTLCGLPMTLPATDVGWQTTCPGCNHPFRVYIPGGASQSSLLTCSDCLARISPRTFGHLADDHKVLCYRCLCKANPDLINNHMLPAMPPERLLTQLYCDRCKKYMSFPPSALDRVVSCPHCFRPVHPPSARNAWQLSIRLAIWLIVWILVLGVIASFFQSCEY